MNQSTDLTHMATHRRPVALWLVVGLLSAPVLLGYAVRIYVRFFSTSRVYHQIREADWSLLDFVMRSYPGLLILLGCVGLVMLRRWAVYVFAVLLVLRLRDAAPQLLEDQHPDAPAIVLWLPFVTMVLPLIGFLYSFYLARKGTLRKGFRRSA